MNKEKQITKIAEACGYENVKIITISNVKLKGDDQKIGMTSDKGWLPDYLNDLNAMHVAELTLPFVKRKSYKQHLSYVITPPELRDSVRFKGENYRATASQRAEAFLRTLKLWVD